MNRLNKMILVGLLTLSCIPAWAGHKDYETAKVTRAVPVYEAVRRPIDREVCWDEQTWHRDPANGAATATIFGAILGGVIGNQFGGGSGKTALTVAGAALGGSIANDVSQKRHPVGYYPVTQNRCEVQREWRTVEHIVAWDVSYKYHGQIYQTRMRERPGDRIRVNVDVRPSGY